MYRHWLMSLLCETELAVRAIRVQPSELTFVKNALESSEGIGFMIAKRGGHALLVAPVSQVTALDGFISDMMAEVGLVLGKCKEHEEALRVAL